MKMMPAQGWAGRYQRNIDKASAQRAKKAKDQELQALMGVADSDGFFKKYGNFIFNVCITGNFLYFYASTPIRTS